MSDEMLVNVLRMPYYDFAMGDEISRHQYWQRGQQAADEIERLREENRTLRETLRRDFSAAIHRFSAALRQLDE